MSGREEDARWMRRCLELAGRARGRTAPNPMVGAVVVRDGEVLGEGYTYPPPGAHGEVAALRRVADARGATMYVNLEPCCHHGRTPPCTDAVLAAGIKRVVVGLVDPFPQVRGQGIRILREAGVEVTVGVEEEACRLLNAGFVKAVETGLPYVWLKAGASLDGRIADAGGRSKWITSEEARAEGRRIRDRVDAILVGSGTLLADDPALTTRIEGGHDPLPVILDSGLRCPADARVLRGPRRPVIVCREHAPERALPADILRVPEGVGGLDLDAVMRALVARGVHNVLVEGGGAVHRSLIDAGLADRLLLFLAPTALAGGAGFVGGPPLALADAPRWTLRSVRQVGPDALLDLDLTPERSPEL